MCWCAGVSGTGSEREPARQARSAGGVSPANRDAAGAHPGTLAAGRLGCGALRIRSASSRAAGVGIAGGSIFLPDAPPGVGRCPGGLSPVRNGARSHRAGTPARWKGRVAAIVTAPLHRPGAAPRSLRGALGAGLGSERKSRRRSGAGRGSGNAPHGRICRLPRGPPTGDRNPRAPGGGSGSVLGRGDVRHRLSARVRCPGGGQRDGGVARAPRPTARGADDPIRCRSAVGRGSVRPRPPARQGLRLHPPSHPAGANLVRPVRRPGGSSPRRTGGGAERLLPRRRRAARSRERSRRPVSR